MEGKIGTSLAEIFEELEQIYKSLDAGLSTLALLEQATKSPDMAQALGLVGDYMRGAVEDVGSLAVIGKRSTGSC